MLKVILNVTRPILDVIKVALDVIFVSLKETRMILDGTREIDMPLNRRCNIGCHQDSIGCYKTDIEY